MENEFGNVENKHDGMQDTKDSYTEENGQVNAESSREEELPAGRKLRNSIIELCIYVAIIVICVAFVPKYVLQRTIVD